MIDFQSSGQEHSSLEDLPDLSDYDYDSDDEYDSTDSDSSLSSSSSSSEEDDISTCSSNSWSSSSLSLLSTIIEETEEDLMSISSISSSQRYNITTPGSCTLESYLSKASRRIQIDTIDITNHESPHVVNHKDERCLDEDVCHSSLMDSLDSMGDKSFEDDVSSGFKIAKRRLRKELSTIHLRRVIQNATTPIAYDDLSQSSSFTINRQKSSECLHHMAQTLLNSPPPERARSNYTQARRRLQTILTIDMVLAFAE